MKSKTLLPQFRTLATFAALSMGAHAATVVYLPTSATPILNTGSNQTFAGTITGAGFSGGLTIASGTTTLETALSYTALGTNVAGGGTNGRIFAAQPTDVVSYFFSTARTLDGLLLWNYTELFSGATYSERGITRADITVSYGVGQTLVLNDVVFNLAPDTNSASTVAAAQQVSFGSQLANVTQISLSDLQGGGPNGSGGTIRGWQEFAVYAVPEPSAALLGGLGLLALLRRRRH